MEVKRRKGRRPELARRFEHVEGSEHVGFKILARLVDGSGDGDLGGEVIDFVDVAGGVENGGGVANVAFEKFDAIAAGLPLEPGEIVRCTGAGKVVEDADMGGGVGEQALGEIGADESGAAGDQDGARPCWHVCDHSVRSLVHAVNP